MRTLAALLIIAALASSCVSGRKNAINLYGGVRDASGDFGGAENTPMVGIEGMLGLTKNGVSVEGGYAYAKKDSSGTSLKTDELYAGIRKTWNPDGLVQPYVGAGADYISGNVSPSAGPTFTGDGWGGYLRGGVGFQIALFQAGVDLRGALSSAEVQGQDLSYVQGTIFIGVSL